ncbi:MAG TPA: amidohydrolase family protein [Candidatus Limnocylindrales bacterium]
MSSPQVERLVVGRIATLAGPAGFAWVEALAISGGNVIAAGKLADLQGMTGPRTRRILLQADEVAIPALTDAHLHLGDAAIARSEIDLTDLSLDGALSLIGEAHARARDDGAWLVGAGWDIDHFGAWPTATDLATIAPGRRIALWSRDHHAIWASPEGLTAAGVGERTVDPPGGRIRRDPDGRPEGVLLENAATLAASAIPPPTVEALELEVPALARELLELGIAAVHDPGSLLPDPRLERAVVAFGHLSDRGELPIRVHLSIRRDGLAAARSRSLRSGEPIGSMPRPRGSSPRPIGSTPEPRAHMGWLKLFADGALGSRTAALLGPQGGSPAGSPGDGSRIFVTQPGELAELAREAVDAGIASQIHAIGDAAVRAALGALEPIAGRSNIRPRIEHVQLLHPADVSRFATAGIVASVQPSHLRTDAAPARAEWGERAEADGYPYGALAAAGATLAFGSDAPVETIDPWPGLELAATRRSPDWPEGTPPFGPAQALALERILRAACVGAAVAAGESRRGRLRPRSPADLIVIPVAALAEPVEVGGPLGRVRPRLVLVEGQVVVER